MHDKRCIARYNKLLRIVSRLRELPWCTCPTTREAALSRHANGPMTQLVKPYLSVDQARALVAAAEDRAFKMARVLITHPQQGNREPVLLAGAVSRLKDALAECERSDSCFALAVDRRRD